MENKKPWYIMIVALLLVYLIAWLLTQQEKVDAGQVDPVQRIGAEPFAVECTAYCDTGTTASGKQTIEGLTIAGAREWMGCACIMWDSEWNFIGIYQFTDTGYGRDGDIPRGETVDIYIPDYDACIQWGRRDVYIQIIDGKG